MDMCLRMLLSWCWTGSRCSSSVLSARCSAPIGRMQGLPGYDFARRRGRAGTAAIRVRLQHRDAVRPGPAGNRRPDRGPGEWRGSLRSGRVARAVARSIAAGGRARYARAERLHRSLRPGRGRAARRPRLHHALAPLWRAGSALPRGQGRPVSTVRRRGPGDHQRRHGRGHRCLLVPGAEGARQPRRQRDRAPDGRTAAP